MSFKNIFVIAPDSGATYNHTRALKRAGFPVQVLNFQPLIRENGIRRTMAEMERQVRGAKPDLVFVTLTGDSYQFPIDFFSRLGQGARLVMWSYDDDSYYEIHGRYYAQAADAVVTMDNFSRLAYERLGIPAVLCSAPISAEICRPLDIVQDIDVSFVGDCTKADRKEYLAHLAASGVKVQSWGLGSQNGFLAESEWAKITARSKIVLNFTKLDKHWLNQDEPILARLRGYKGRPIELAMARAFCLTEYYPALPLIFELGREMDYFCDKPSLLDKVRHYLAHEKERLAMAGAAYLRAREQYDDAKYIVRVLGELESRLNGPGTCLQPATAYMGPRFKESQINVLFVHMLSALERRQFRVVLQIFPTLFQHGPFYLIVGAWRGLRRTWGYLLKRGISRVDWKRDG